MSLNPFRAKSKLGIDIGTSSIKIAELEKDGGRFTLLNYGIFELKNVRTDSTAENQMARDRGILKLPDEEIVWGIQEIIKKADMKSRDAVASIPAVSTFGTVIEMPYLSGEDLAKAIAFEAKKYIPIPIKDVVLDWSIIEVLNPGQITAGKDRIVKEQKPSTVEIFLAAVSREETQKYLNIMKSAGLTLRALELENAALIRGLIGNDLSPIAIVNIGGRSTSITIVNKGYERISHNYEIGGFEITKSIARSLSISLEKADELKMKFGMKEGDENVINESVASLIDMMAFETRKTLTNYEEAKNLTLSKVLLVGGVANIPYFLEYFKSKLGRDIVAGNPFSRVVYPQELSAVLPSIGNTLSVAIGLAMREI
ncbi:MAG: hypothetical protein A3B99_03070 [Candidatus Yanofskybacteria bacterium RIFCSPHIGHO2_02_FULL_44_12b]|uniref:SHS2 domain-containing protein n=2 Tax=Candidatus Yanofskyibacteriota TaxID=1752733 RepID=A0A1F8GPE5_9BACT|nr:MAG: type IV pilus assembly protein PilM, nonfunctional [Candidatus Yanofskybacteria bacterium GW2011_GWA2_44_9]OGN05506.1 MAG: hypothetical protein A2659_02845 [Candidatus Yanofskybacteria bacterium RIFCSPHIGHO2_01_FULL_44_24]OGN15057.1 MAG: hypothetical protein A3B99_03070 [Candidatus Yanofskybacteria bacterium RIFCSPHIGHO2_02_FULL_44_12b]OGN26526.1 MAG: hypothetical protein A2925_03215 [Candidatus Yanofskybacteria bacterium RIFCSPLOWO2_01_FULL_44_22]